MDARASHTCSTPAAWALGAVRPFGDAPWRGRRSTLLLGLLLLVIVALSVVSCLT